MSAEHLQQINRIIRNGWKGLANADQTEASEVIDVLKKVLDELEAIESATEAK